MMINLLVDTNVWIYAMDKGSNFYSSAQSIMLNPNYNLFITSKNIATFNKKDFIDISEIHIIDL